MFTLPALLTLVAAALAAAVTCALALAAGAVWPTALLSAGAAGGATLGLLCQLLKDRHQGND
ncbi:hypothetical protein Misp01_78530 [Microtetraspora sp. NBRC 13810]|uniref:hypothetical protein n=1 Tax=Microtetraspora sp. NBRC 13810 TaxID=3030990 RepID=UPI0024A56719|nr:hypothetical protein [Microtetraspora sp. NBRC 13810]GLW12725.1 hypothetical protein Misp01_78530 [Microtetraspora sp. NBRC 13810]